jgi:WD40 repeat protein
MCPTPTRLKDLLNGRLRDTEQAELIGHLDVCERCQQALDELGARGQSWSESVRQMGHAPPEHETALQEVILVLKDKAQWTRVQGQPAAEDKLLLSFLTPSTEPGYLGQLGQYKVAEVLGRGGMGVVLKAFDPSLHRNVAIKVLAPQLAASAAARERFAREGRAAAAVSHEHVVLIHAVSEESGLPYLVMEYVPGLSLQERLDRTGPLQLTEILRIGMQTAAGLSAAHAQGLIHRDIKPANILLENGVERVKITDFGLARTVDDASLTQSGVLAGTPHYMAPEQARGEPLDCRADLFSLGSVLYALCTGRPPFRAGTTLAVLRRVSEETPHSVQLINPEIPTWLAELIAQLHAQDPNERYQSAADVADLLAQFLAYVQQPALNPLPQRPGKKMAVLPPAKRRSRPWLVPVLVLLAAGAVMGLRFTLGPRSIPSLLWNSREGHSSQETVLVQVDDADLEVTIDQGPDEIVLEGLGRHEVHLRPGKHQLRASKDGMLVYSEIFSLKQGNPQRVRVPRIEASSRRSRLLDQGKETWSVAFSPDGNTLAAASGLQGEKGLFRLWDTRSGKAKATWHEDQGVRSVAFSRNGKLLATGEFDNNAKLRDPVTGEVCAVLRGHQDGVNCVAFSPDNKTLATASLDHTIKLWDVSTLDELKTLRGHHGWVLSLAFSTDGKTLFTSSADQTAKVWDVASGAERKTLEGHVSWVEYVAVSPNGKLLATASFDSTVKLWDAKTGEELDTLPAHMSDIYCVKFSPNSKELCTGSQDGTVCLWEVKTLRQLANLPAHGGKVYGLAYSPDGRSLATASLDGTVKLWDLTGRLPRATHSRVSRFGPAGESNSLFVPLGPVGSKQVPRPRPRTPPGEATKTHDQKAPSPWGESVALQDQRSEDESQELLVSPE